MSEVECHLEFTYSSEETAKKILQAVDLENYPYVKAKLEGNTLISVATAESLDSLIHTLEDYLSCISVAEKMLGER
ncbi:MAG: hypothetical protein LN412_05275 [Candidatus Thermoplasmatota archaeon]|nr:hypothetical protein [Candidatus Thermoplasmatota archaeon]